MNSMKDYRVSGFNLVELHDWLSYYLRGMIPDWLKVFVTWLISATSFLLRKVHIVLWVFVGMFLLDTVTGYMVARRCGDVSSERMRAGVLKLFLYFVVIICGTLLDLMIFEEVKHRGLFYLSTAYCASVEAQSVLENVQKLGGKTPSLLVLYLRRLFGGSNDLKCKRNGDGSSDSGDGQGLF